MKDKEAGILFERGFNCAQSVAAAFAVDCGMTVEDACRFASAFGAGMARAQETCGAVTGGLMALGLARGFADSGDAEGKARILAAAKALLAEFRRAFGTISCRELLGGTNLDSEAGRRAYNEGRQSELVCRKYVEASARIVEGLVR